MYCAVYKSPKKIDTYLYLAKKDNFACLPAALLKLLGQPVYVMELELTAERKLAQEDVQQVMKNLQMQGWHLQMPPSDKQAPVH